MMEFFKGYNNIRCNHDEFEFIKEYLWKDDWSWYNHPDDYNPDDLALISIKGTISDKKIIPVYLDEIEIFHRISYIQQLFQEILPDKDVKEIIREIKLKELGI